MPLQPRTRRQPRRKDLAGIALSPATRGPTKDERDELDNLLAPVDAPATTAKNDNAREQTPEPSALKLPEQAFVGQETPDVAHSRFSELTSPALAASIASPSPTGKQKPLDAIPDVGEGETGDPQLPMTGFDLSKHQRVQLDDEIEEIDRHPESQIEPVDTQSTAFPAQAEIHVPGQLVIKESNPLASRNFEGDMFDDVQGMFGIPLVLGHYKVERPQNVAWNLFPQDCVYWAIFGAPPSPGPAPVPEERFRVRTIVQTLGKSLLHALSPRALVVALSHALLGMLSQLRLRPCLAHWHRRTLELVS
jgi:hypothetical protein